MPLSAPLRGRVGSCILRGKVSLRQGAEAAEGAVVTEEAMQRVNREIPSGFGLTWVQPGGIGPGAGTDTVPRSGGTVLS